MVLATIAASRGTCIESLVSAFRQEPPAFRQGISVVEERQEGFRALHMMRGRNRIGGLLGADTIEKGARTAFRVHPSKITVRRDKDIFMRPRDAADTS